jgi:hypothetical protein
MRKIIRNYGFWIVPGMILGAFLWMLIPKGVFFRFRYNTTVDTIPGSVFQFIFGFSAEGHEVVQVNPVGVFMLLLIVIALVIPWAGKKLRHPYAWEGFLLMVSSILLIAFPFLSLISRHYLDRIEMAEAFDIPITITYALGFPLVLAAVFLFGTGILAFFVDREKSDPRKAWMARTSQKHKKTTPSSKNPIRSQKNHVR